MALQWKAEHIYTVDMSGGPASAVKLKSPNGASQSVRMFSMKWWNDGLAPQWPGGTITRCVTFAMPTGDAASSYTECDWILSGPNNVGNSKVEYLLIYPWNPANSQNDVSFATVDPPGPGGYGEDGYSTLTPKAPIKLIDRPLTLKPIAVKPDGGEAKVRQALDTARTLYQTRGILTELEVGNELNFGSIPATEVPGNTYAFSGPGLTPGAYAQLFHEICRVASDSQYLVFPTPSGRIPIFSLGAVQYFGNRETADQYQSVTWTPPSPDRNPYRQGGPDPQLLRYPDVRYVWEWLDQYYQIVNSLDGGPAAYPGAYGASPRPGTSIIDYLDGFSFHLYQERMGTPESWTTWSDNWKTRADWFLSRVGVTASGPGGATYPSYYRNLSVFATEASFANTQSQDWAKSAYGAVVDSYNGYANDNPSAWPQNRLRRFYLHPVDNWDSTGTFDSTNCRDILNPNCFSVDKAVGIHHRDVLTFCNPYLPY